MQHFIRLYNNYSMLIILTLFHLIQSLSVSQALPSYTLSLGYPTQTHKIPTSDGYSLTFFRIQQKGSTFKSNLTPVYLHHGVLESADSWLINEEDKAIGFILANKGYDVWLGNSRGNKYSREVIAGRPAAWVFSFREMAEFDLPAAMQYIYDITGRKVNYIGHSQGSLIMNIALSKNIGSVETHLNKYLAISPIAYLQHQYSSLLETFNDPNYMQSQPHNIFHSDGDHSLLNYDRLGVFMDFEPSGTSLVNVMHWRQMASTGRFQAFDYGRKGNLERYGREVPHLWKPQNIRVPVRLFVGSLDTLADVDDVNRFWGELQPIAKKFYKIYNAGHATFLWGKDVTPWMDDILAQLEE